MTWYASQIIALGTPTILSAVASEPLFCCFAYHVRNPLHHAWHRPDIVHEVPPEGLDFIRPVCEQDSEDPGIAEWHEHQILPWNRFDSRSDVELAIHPDKLRDRSPALADSHSFPPAGVLQAAKQLHLATNAPVVFYHCASYGGAPEIEHAWIFADTEYVLVRLVEYLPEGEERMLQITNDGVVDRPEDVLRQALRALGCQLPTPYFAPHTRSFLWERYRIG